MYPTDIQSRIQSAAARLANEIAAAVAEALSDVASGIATAAPTTRAGKKAHAVTAAAATPPKPGTRIRRSEAQLASDGERIVKLLAANRQGMRIEQINAQLGAAPKKLAQPIMMLLAKGAIVKTGEKRATLYFPATATAKRTAANTGKKAAPKGRKPVLVPNATSAVTSEHVLALLSSSKEGLRAEQITKALGTTSAAIQAPIRQLLEQREIKRSGVARGTVYSKA